jgi:hypothetical protein
MVSIFAGGRSVSAGDIARQGALAWSIWQLATRKPFKPFRRIRDAGWGVKHMSQIKGKCHKKQVLII